MNTDFDITKVNEQYYRLELKNLNGHEIQALGKLLSGIGETKSGKELVEKHLLNLAGTGAPTNGLN